MATVVTVTMPMLPIRFTAEVRGPRAVVLLRRANVPHKFEYKPPSGGSKCWLFPSNRVDDVLAAATLMRGVFVEVKQEALL